MQQTDPASALCTPLVADAGHEMSRQLLELLRIQALPRIELTLVVAEVAGA